MRFFRKKQKDTSSNESGNKSSESTLHNDHELLSKRQIRTATRTRAAWAYSTSFFLLLSVIFLILVEIGNTSNRSVLRDIWFIKLNLTNVIPTSVPNSVLLNSIAQSLGLHDFYQVGLWNYCEGYNAQGVTDCAPTKTLYWFDPVQIILSELLAGASIALPASISSILDIIKTASHWMFGLFLTGACLSFVLIFVVPISIFSRWVAFLVAIITFLNALFITAASVIATAMFIIMRNVFQSNTDVNIGATIGTEMFAFMWIASGCAIITFVIHLCLSCCCASRRDVKTGRKAGNKKAYEEKYTPGAISTT